MFNVSKWKSEVKAIETEIRAHKEFIRSKSMADTSDWERFYHLKNQATMMYRVRAQYRGKLHNKLQVQILSTVPGKYGYSWLSQKPVEITTLDEQRALILDALWNAYVLPDPVEAVPA